MESWDQASVMDSAPHPVFHPTSLRPFPHPTKIHMWLSGIPAASEVLLMLYLAGALYPGPLMSYLTHQGPCLRVQVLLKAPLISLLPPHLWNT